MTAGAGAAGARAFIGLGANLGDPAATIAAAIVALGRLPGTCCLRASRLYRTPPWGLVEQPAFVNAVAEVATSLSPRALLEALLGLEREFGRDRAADVAQRWGPRALDLDLLLHGSAVIDQPGLQLPHPQLHQRGFVLVPLLEIAPDLHVPGVGSARAALAAVATDGIEAIG